LREADMPAAPPDPRWKNRVPYDSFFSSGPPVSRLVKSPAIKNRLFGRGIPSRDDRQHGRHGLPVSHRLPSGKRRDRAGSVPRLQQPLGKRLGRGAQTYRHKINWKETTYPLKSGKWVYVTPIRKGCFFRFELNRDGIIVGYRLEGDRCY